ncbi:uncharacterized protein LOC133858355 [Alnus glutinosa]|uniref:uncharacterized protein LOC133858355 n=1 Tax=Alnus glutinosa TaxID=3517 RepID=UPI002D7777A4|nr:uncharacterized protein LOC133858355 [Alnus glutinosa]
MASGSFSFAFFDSSSPYYLHHGDSPGSVLVSQLLQGDNYHTWSRSMIMALTAKNKLKFVDGSLKKPSTELEDEFHAWNRSTNMVLSWILNSVSKDIATSVIYINSAEEMWTDLKDRFSQKNGPRIFQLQKAISSHSQQNVFVSEYYTRLKGLWDELTNYRPIPQCSYDTPKILANHYHQEERQRVISVNPIQVETATLLTKTASQYQNQPNRIGKPPFRKERPACTHCGLLGHTMEKCYKLHGYPLGYTFNKNKLNSSSANQVQEADQPFQVPQLSISQEQIQQLLALIKQSTSNSVAEVSSPSAHQVVNSQDHLFSNMGGNGSHSIPFSFASFLSKLKHSMVNSVISSASVSVSLDMKHSVFSTSHLPPHISSINLHSWIIDTGATDHMISTVSLFTSITATISSCVKLPNGNFAMVTHIGTVKLSSLLDWMTIGVGRQHGGLFYLMHKPRLHSAQVYSASIKNTSNDIWHYRLVCPLAKQHKLPFPSSISVSQASFDLIHCDLWESVSHPIPHIPSHTSSVPIPHTSLDNADFVPNSVPVSTDPIFVRRSTRVKCKPGYLQQYHYKLADVCFK